MMSEIWPLDVKRAMAWGTRNPIRPFKCLMLMPFEARFDAVAEIIRSVVTKLAEGLLRSFTMEKVDIKRVDWVTSSGVIQQEIWREIEEADLIFCDITGYNPNVMFEAGVCAAWKEMKQVVFIKDRFFKQQSAFDIAPIRYTEYELTSDGVNKFREKVVNLVFDVLIGFPDGEDSAPSISLPFSVDFSSNQDDRRIYTPPFAHRRVKDGMLEFGSIASFPDSWASIGKEKFLNFELEFVAQFRNPIPGFGYIGVGVRSQHYYANFAHILYLNHDGTIIITEPNEEPPLFYKDRELRKALQVDLLSDHTFKLTFGERTLSIQVDDFKESFQVADMKKVFGQGLIRFQSHSTWMGLKEVKVKETTSPD